MRRMKLEASSAKTRADHAMVGSTADYQTRAGIGSMKSTRVP